MYPNLGMGWRERGVRIVWFITTIFYTKKALFFEQDPRKQITLPYLSPGNPRIRKGLAWGNVEMLRIRLGNLCL